MIATPVHFATVNPVSSAMTPATPSMSTKIGGTTETRPTGRAPQGCPDLRPPGAAPGADHRADVVGVQLGEHHGDEGAEDRRHDVAIRRALAFEGEDHREEHDLDVDPVRRLLAPERRAVPAASRHADGGTGVRLGARSQAG